MPFITGLSREKWCKLNLHYYTESHLSLFIRANLIIQKSCKSLCQYSSLLLSRVKYSLYVPHTFLSGSFSKASNNLGFLLNINSYGEWLAKLGELNVLWAKVAKGKYLCHICLCPLRCFVKILDNDLIPCSTCKDWWLYGLQSWSSYLTSSMSNSLE